MAVQLILARIFTEYRVAQLQCGVQQCFVGYFTVFDANASPTLRIVDVSGHKLQLDVRQTAGNRVVDVQPIARHVV